MSKIKIVNLANYLLPATVLWLGFVLVSLTFFISRNIGDTHLATGINQQINYQGRLLNSAGAVVPDGSYNVEFKIYQDGDGVIGGGDETLEWTETRTGSNKVLVKNGYFSVYLGSITPFGSNVDWNQDTLWLSVNIGSTGAPSWDGEMSPFTRFSSTPYALNSKALNGLESSNFVQLAQGTQTDASTTNASISINKTGGTANILDLMRSGVSVLSIANNGATSFRNTTNTTTAFQIQNAAGEQLINVDTSTTNNLITNSNFESNTTGWAAKGSSTISQTTSQKFLGNGSLSIANDAANEGAKYDYALASQTTYTLTFYAKSSSLTVAATTINIGRTEDGATDSNCATGQTINGAGWTKISCVFTTGNVTGTNHIYIKQTDATARTIYIDSVQLQTSASLIGNTDFEVNTSDWVGYSGAALAQTGTQFYTGAGSMQVSTSTTSGSVEGASANASLTPSTTYRVSFWVQLDAGAAGSKTFWLYKRFDSTDPAQGTAYASASLSPGVWTNITADITTSSVIHANPFIAILTTDPGDFVTSEIFYVDNVGMAPVKYDTNDIGRIRLNGIIDSPVVIQGQTSTNALQVQSAAGSIALKVDTLNGRVGIGTNSPAASLHVQGKTYIQDTSSNTDTLFIEGSTGLDALKVGANSRIVTIGDSTYSTSNGQLNVYGTALVKNQVNSIVGFRVQNSSSVNIFGVDTTNSRLFSGIADGASSTGFTLNTSNTYSTSGAKLLSVQNNTTEKFSIDKDGNLTLASGAVFKIDSTSGLSSSCGSGQFLRGQVALGGLTTSGTCAEVTGTEITDGSIANGDLANSSINLALGTSGSDINWGASSVSLGGTATLFGKAMFKQKH
ncbi:carbohydrate binding domain-containing protein [Candidatus Saccharibacteria bacterium]|nr:carbohydrate binding domain-containing protein [Candidatus Saccharibacteria bacterium]